MNILFDDIYKKLNSYGGSQQLINLLTWSLIWLAPAMILFALYWSIVIVDNKVSVLLSDTTILLRHTCDLVDLGPWQIMRAYADHIVITIYIFSAIMIELFGRSYIAYSLALLMWYALAISGLGAVVYSFTRSKLVTFSLIAVLSTGWWISRAAVTDFSEIASPMVVTFTCLALLFLRDPERPRKIYEIAGAAIFCFLAFATISPGFLAFAVVGLTAFFAWAAQQLNQVFRDKTFRLHIPDWRLWSVLVAAFCANVFLYWLGTVFMNNPRPGSMVLERGSVTASTLMRVLSLMRAAISNIFANNYVVDGSIVDNAYWFGKLHEGVFLTPLIAAMLLAVGAALVWIYRDTILHQKHVASGAVAVGLAALVSCILISIASVMGRPVLLLGYTRYIIFPLILFALSLALVTGVFLRRYAGTRSGHVACIVVLVATSVVTTSNLLCLQATRSELKEFRSFYQRENRETFDWWTGCGLL